MKQVNVIWFRRDLRLEDNHALYEALKDEYPVLPIFIFDVAILKLLPNKEDARVTFIHQSLEEMNAKLAPLGKQIQFFYGETEDIFKDLVKEFEIKKVFVNEDYEPYAISRDSKIEAYLKLQNVDFELYKDQVIFQKNEVLKADGTPYTMFTPYSKVWLQKFAEIEIKKYNSEGLLHLLLSEHSKNLSLQDIGFKRTAIQFPPVKINTSLIKVYDENRNSPFKDATSRISLHLRFGTKSIRQLVAEVKDLNVIFLKELIWREFFMQILFHFPKVVNHNFKAKYNGIQWRNDEAELKRWCEGKTGFPIVDAGMRQLNATGFMHNRVRMIAAGFLVKDLLIDWKIGEAYFAEKLLDYELSSNNGNWQWAAGTGCDAAPYFRIFNPVSQQEKFDPDFKYIKKWVPEYGTEAYPHPMVDHKKARLRALEVYKKGMQD